MTRITRLIIAPLQLLFPPASRPLKVINKQGKTRKVVVFARERYMATKGGINE